MESQSIKAIRAGDGRDLVVAWKNGTETPVDVGIHLARYAVFQPIDSGAVAFGDVRQGENGWSAHWSDEMEISVDTLWRLALEQGAAWLKAWRQARGLTQEAAAEVLGLSLRMIRYYEAGRHMLPKTVRLACLGSNLEHAA